MRIKIFAITKLLISIFMIVSIASCSGDGRVSGSSSLESTVLMKTAGDNQFAPINVPFPTPLTVQISNYSNLENIPIYFEVDNNFTNVSLSNNVVYTDSSGIASVIVNSNSNIGLAKVKAKVVISGIEISEEFSLNINGNANQWEIEQVGGASSVTAGDSFQITVRALLSGGGVDTTFTGAKYIAFSTTNGNSPNSTSPMLPPDGFYNFTNGEINSPLNITLFNSSENITDTFTVQVSGSALISDSITPIQVLDDAITQVKIVDTASCASANTIDNVTLINATITTYYALYFDSYDNCIEASTPNVTWTTTFADSQVRFEEPLSSSPDPFTGNDAEIETILGGFIGSISITDIASPSLTDSTGTITTSSGTATQFTISGIDTPANYLMNAGVTSQLLIEARDIYGNTATSYNGSISLTITANASATTPPADIPPTSTLPTINGFSTLSQTQTYTFANGILISPIPQMIFYNANENPTITVSDGLITGTSPLVTVNNTAHTYSRIRSAANSPLTIFDASSLTPSTDDIFNLYCATYDSFGNYLFDQPANWSTTGVITTAELSPSLTAQTSVQYEPTNFGMGDITCDVGGLTDSSGIFNITPGTPFRFEIDGGNGDASGFTSTASNNFSIDIKVYDQDGNFASNYNGNENISLSYIGPTSVDPNYPAQISPSITSPRINGLNGNSQSFTANFISGIANIANNYLINTATTTDRVRLQVIDQAANIASAYSGFITVNNDILESILIRDASNNAGSAVIAPAVNTDDTISLYSAGYDSAGNYISDQNAIWSTSTGSAACTNSDLSSTSGLSTIFNPSISGTCTVTANVGGITDDTGAVISSNGTATNFTITLVDGSTNIDIGNSFSLRVTARDADGNRVYDYIPASTYTINNTSVNSPEGTIPDTWTLNASDFVLGEAIITNLKIYNDLNFTVTVTESTGGTGISNTSSPITTSPGIVDHFVTSNPSGTFSTDGLSTFQIDIEARDQWGNLTTKQANLYTINSLTAKYISGDELNVHTINGFTPFNFLAGTSVHTIAGLSYPISHEIKILAENTNSNSTVESLSSSITFTPDINQVSYLRFRSFSDISPIAGSTITTSLEAIDIAGNIVTGSDLDLTGLSFTFSSAASTTVAPYNNVPSNPSFASGTLSFTNGISNNVSYTFYNKESISNTSFTVTASNGLVGVGSETITVQEDVLDHYANITSPSPSYSGDGSSTFSAVITARDQYGNIVSGDSSLTIFPTPQDGHIAGVLGGTTVINLSSGSQTVNDLTYNASGTIKLDATGLVTMDNTSIGRSATYNFNSVAGAIASYEVFLSDGASVTAGDSTYTLQVTAKDSSNNTVTGADAYLNSVNFTLSNLNNSPEGDNPTPNGVFNIANFTSGVGSYDITPVNAEVISMGLLLQDANNIAGTSVPITVIADVFDHIVISGSNSGTADSSTTYTATIQGRDQFGNPQTSSNPADSNLTLSVNRVAGINVNGTLTSNTGINLQSSDTVVRNVTYDVGHSTRFDLTTATVPVDTNLTPIVSWQVTTGTVASYDLDITEMSKTAGVPTTLRLIARDALGNQIIGDDSILNTLTIVAAINSDCDAKLGAPETVYTSLPNNNLATPVTSYGGFNNGVLSVPITFYSTTNCLNVGQLTFTDNNAISASNTAAMTITPNIPNYFRAVATGFPAQARDDQAVQNSTQLTITQYDRYGNPTIGGSTGNLLSIFDISGYASGENQGSMSVCSDTAGNGCVPGARTTIGSTSLDFTNNSVQNIYDFSYDVGGVNEIRVTDGSVTTQSGNGFSDDLTWSITSDLISHYVFENPSTNATSGTASNFSLGVYDNANNIIDDLAAQSTILNTINFTVTQNSSNEFDAPDSSALFSFGPSTLSFTNGVSNVALVLYSLNDINAGDLTITDSLGITTLNTGTTRTINDSGADHFEIVMSSLPTPLANGLEFSSSSAAITLYDTYGNPSTTTIPVTIDFLVTGDTSNYGNVRGTMLTSTTPAGAAQDILTLPALDFSSASTQYLYKFSYNVGHKVYLTATAGSTLTDIADSTIIDWIATADTIDSYTFTAISSNITAGSNNSWLLTAKDAAGNIMNNKNSLNKSILDSLMYTFSDTSTASSMNGPISGVVDLPSPSTHSWSAAGTLSLSDFIFYNATNNVQLGDITVTDGNIIQANTATIDVLPKGVGSYFTVSSSGFPVDADSTSKLSTDATISLFDQYGNLTTDPSITAANLMITNIIGYPTKGNLQARLTDGSGPFFNVETSYDFSSTDQINLYDFSYDVAHDFDLEMSSGAVTTTTPSSLSWGFSSSTVSSYNLTFQAPTTISAGDNAIALLGAYDSAGNAITTNDSELDAINFTFSTTHPTSPNATAPTIPVDSTLTFSAGVATLNYIFTDASNLSGATDITVTDTTNSIITNASNNLIIAPRNASSIPLGSYVITDPSDTNAGGSSNVTVTAYDGFGNYDSNFSTNVTLNADGSATGDGIVTILSGTGSLNISNNISEVINLTLSDSSSTGMDISSIQDLVFDHDVAHTLEIVTSGTTVSAGTCIGPIIVQRKDQYGNLTDDGTTTINLATDQTGTFFTDACSTSTTSVSITDTNTSTIFYYQGTNDASHTLTVSGLITNDSLSENITPATATSLAWSGSISTTAGTLNCSTTPLTITRRDNYGNLVTSGSMPLTLNSTSTGTYSFFVDSGCTNSTLQIVDTQSAATIYYRDTLMGSPIITTTNLNAPSSSSISIDHAPSADIILFSTTATSPTTDDCIDIKLDIEDTYGNEFNDGFTPISLNAFGTGIFFSDSSCSTTITSISIPIASTTTTLYYKDNNTGSGTISSSSAVTTEGSLALNIDHGAAYELEITAAPTTVSAGTCIGPITVQRKDENGNLTDNATTIVNLASDQTGTFYSDACSTSTTSVSITDTNSSTVFYYLGTNSASHTLSVTGLTTNDSIIETITPAAASTLSWSGSISTTAGNTNCSVTPLTITRRDAFGNLVTSGVLPLTLNSTSTGVNSFFTDSACTNSTIEIQDTQSAANIYYRDDLMGNPTISTTNLNAPSIAVSVDHNSEYSLEITTTGSNVTAGTCIGPITVQRKDQYNNLTDNGITTVNLATDQSGTFYSDPCTTPTTSVSITDTNTNTSFYYNGTNDSSHILTVSGLIAGDTVSQIITPAVASSLTWSGSISTIAGNTNCSTTPLTITRKDTFGNLVTSGVLPLTLNSTSTGTNSFFTDSSCINSTIEIQDTQSSQTIYYRDTLMGSPTITATNLSSPSTTVSIDHNSADVLIMSTSSVSPKTTDCIDINIEVQDAFGNANDDGFTPIGLDTFTLLSDSFFADPSCSSSITSTSIASSSTTKTVYYKNTSIGSGNITTTSAVTTEASLALNIDHGAAYELEITAAPTTVSAGACIGPITVQRKDENGNLTDNATTTVNLATDQTGTFYSDACSTSTTSVSITDTNTSTVFYYRGTNDTSHILTVSGLTINDTLSENITPAAATSLAWTGSISTIAGNTNCSGTPLTITRRDAFGNLVTSGTMPLTLNSASTGTSAFFTDSSCLNSTIEIQDTQSAANIYYRDDLMGSPTISTTNLNAPSTASVFVDHSTADVLVMSTTTIAPTTDNCIDITIDIEDAFGNLSNDGFTPINLIPFGSGSFFSDPSCSTSITSTAVVSSNTSTTVYYKDTTISSGSISTASTASTQGSQVLSINHGALANLSFSTQPIANVITNTTFPTQPIINATDAGGNTYTTNDKVITLSAFTDSSCTTPAIGNLTGNSNALSSGSATFTGLAFDTKAVPLFIRATDASITTCSSATNIYAPLNISPSTSPTVVNQNTQAFIISGGVPPLSCGGITPNNSGSSISSTCTTCNTDDICFTYTAGITGGVTDMISISDNDVSSANINITVNGGDLDNSGDDGVFEGGTGDTETFIITNNGNLTITSLSYSGLTAEFTENGVTDTCNGASLAPAASCVAAIDFNATTGTYNTIFNISGGADGGEFSISFSETVP